MKPTDYNLTSVTVHHKLFKSYRDHTGCYQCH